MLLIEPYRTVEIDGKEYYVVFFDFDGCRDADTGEIVPGSSGGWRSWARTSRSRPPGKASGA